MQERYRSRCPINMSVEVFGDRWTLLIIRDLFLGPQRFGDLQAGLPGIGANLLSKRLKELEKENERLRKAVSDLTLDKLILTEAAKGN